ncbi:MAG: tRNA 2-thiouridine(34) synthase MnmA [Patescibacteria group bacterium]
MKKKVFVGMSGGVDSSVTAALLKEKGYDVTGIHLRCFNVDGCAEQDAEDARRAAETLGIPFYVFDFEKEYKERVVKYMVDGYRKGITPNPDVMCNREIKFGLFLGKALSMSADYVATGHYVRRRSVMKNVEGKMEKGKKKFHSPFTISLFTARDTNKDQSYFLWTLTQKDLRHCLFPIGEYVKPEVRKLARTFRLPNADKKDSQGICFLGKVTLSDFLKTYIPEKPGTIFNTKGEEIGRHQGAHFYTIGQRRGIGMGGGNPLYVAEKDVRKNKIVVAEAEDEALTKKEVELVDVNFINEPLVTPNSFATGRASHLPLSVYARVRYRQPLAKATLVTCEKRHENGANSNGNFPVHLHLKFDVPIKFVASGQSAVFYKKSGEMIGGGIIAAA